MAMLINTSVSGTYSRYRRNIRVGGLTFSPSQLANLVQRFLDANPTYYGQALNSYPILTPEETGTVAVPRAGRCWTFDGSNDYGETSGNIGLSGAAQYTFTAWIKHSSRSGWDYQAIYSMGGASNNIGSEFLIDTSGTLYVHLWGTLQSTGYTVPLSTWVHLAVVFDGTNFVTYVNGAQQHSFSATPNLQNSPLRIGGSRLYGTRAFNGSVYDATLFNVAKSPTEIAAIYNQSATPNTIDTTGLLAHYPCAEESGTIGYDASGNGKHLTLTNITQATFHATDTSVKWSLPNQKGYTLALSAGGYSVSKSTDAAFALQGSFTVQAWVYQYSTLSNWENQIACGIGASSRWRFCIAGTDDTGNVNKLRFAYNSNTSVYSTGTIPVGQWTHVAITFSGSNSYKFYINGVLSGSGSTNITPQGSGTPNLYVLGNPSDGTKTLAISRLELFNVEKTLAQVQSSMTSASDTTGVVARYSGKTDLVSGNDLVSGIYGASLEVIIPASLSTPSQDAAGNALGVTGPVCYPATVEVPCVTGDGSAVFAASGSNIGISGAANRTVCFRAKLSTRTGNQSLMHLGDGSANGAFQAFANSGANWYFDQGGSGFDIGVATDTSWHHHAISYDGVNVRWYIDGALVASAARSLNTTNGTCRLLIGYFNGDRSSASICDVRIYSDGKTLSEIQAINNGTDNRTNLVAHWPIQEGPGSSNTNRTSYDTVGTNNLTWNNGTVSTIWANRCPYAQDWSINYGGGIAANGAFVPGRIGSSNDAAGNAKTLAAGKFGNPYSRLCPNAFAAPALVNIGYTASSKLAPTDTVQATSPADTKFRRNASTGSDRYFATLAALTGSDKTNAETYAG